MDMMWRMRGNTSREVSDKDILVGDACKGGVVLEVRNVLNMGWQIGVVLPFGHAFGEEPGDGIASGVMVFEHDLKFLDEVGKGSDRDSSFGEGALSESGCPDEGGSLGYVG